RRPSDGVVGNGQSRVHDGARRGGVQRRLAGIVDRRAWMDAYLLARRASKGPCWRGGLTKWARKPTMKIRHPLLIKAIGWVGAWLIRPWVGTLRYQYHKLG